ncbi:protein lifeguard 4-like [Adelges cooleyi]|uniref:protein lifeguard 4-like n=1 Tax=Adelges cooleyi TaxID=133065 RepID=UPI00217F3855|nr:protein lifeguard 4-like [Adelges cooleyi]
MDEDYRDNEYTNSCGMIYTNASSDKTTTLYHLLESEETEKQPLRICQAFSKKVFTLLILQLCSYNVMGFFCLFTPKIRFFIYNFDYMVSITLVLNVIILIVLHMKRKNYPTNLVLLIIFTVVEACSVGIVVTSFDLFSLLQTLLLTLVAMTTITLYIGQTNKVCLSLTEYFILLIITIFSAGVMAQILLGSTTYELLFSSIGALLFSMFLIHDIQRLMWKLHPDDYVFGTISLYFDVINIIPNILNKLYFNFKFRTFLLLNSI